MRSRSTAVTVAATIVVALLASLPTTPVWCIAADHARAETAPGTCCSPAPTGHAPHGPLTERETCSGCRDISLVAAAHAPAPVQLAVPVSPVGTERPARTVAPLPASPRRDARLASLGTTSLLI